MFTKIEQKILDDPSTSNWLKEQIKAIHKRDVVDMHNDIELLKQCLDIRFAQTLMPFYNPVNIHSKE